MEKIYQIVDAAEALLRGLPPIDRKEDHYNLAVRAEDTAWAVLASVRTEAELRTVHASLKPLMEGLSVKAERYYSYDDYDCSYQRQPVAL